MLLPPASLPSPHPRPTDGAPELRTLLCIGGVDMKQQADVIRNSGIHMVVATPGRLKDMLTWVHWSAVQCSGVAAG
jgi:ATP-dependent RNA helicase DDX41